MSKGRALLALLAITLGACGGDTVQDGPHLAYVTNGIAPFWVIAEAGAEQAGRDLGVRVSVHMPVEGLTDQKRILEDLLTLGADGIAVSAIDPVNQVDLLDHVAARTPLITHDSDAPESVRLCYVGMDNYIAGRMAGALVREAVPDGGDVCLFVGRLEQDNARRRRQGVIDELLGRTPDAERYDPPGTVVEGNGYRILGTLTDQFDLAAGKANAEDALARHPDLDCMVGLFAYNPPMILEALARAGRTGSVKVVGFDEADETLAGILAGSVHGTVVQDPYQYGYRSIEILAALAAGDRSVIPASGFVDIPARQIRAEDARRFWDELNARSGKD